MSAPWIVVIILLWAIVVLLVVTVLGLARRVESLAGVSAAGSTPLDRVPPVGADLTAHDAFARIFGGEPADAVVLFVTSTCQPCRTLMEGLHAAAGESEQWATQLAGVEVVAVTDGAAGEVAYSGNAGVTRVIATEGSEIIHGLGVEMTPFGMAIDRTGTLLASRLLAANEDVLDLGAALRSPAISIHEG